ncbi:sporulation protein [Lentzea flava]|uniref:Sporulation protein n=1 Tax=Lentzea flava TaxID=103732 RepID=A0ABQ2VAG7_9PSEU|nr:sporulation protein [Lentzea flava]MCP2204393.1 sporulation-control protein [Lentzea flava]GGU77034.1 sporulation protein [Lentzea flava]
MFNRMLSALGIGGPSVDTVLDSPHAVPGQAITGQVRVQGGSSDTEIGQVALSLVVGHQAEFFRLVVQEGVRVPANQLVSIPFQLTLPWETPITAVGGMQLPGVNVGVRTELTIAGAPDKGDLDPILVGPLPSQNKVLDAFGQLGFTFRGTEIEAGRQELAFFPPAQYAGGVSEVELTFVASADELYVVLEADKRGGGFSSGDTTGQMRISHQEAQVTDWASAITGWLTQVAGRGQLNPAFGHQPAGFGNQGYDHDGHGQRRGPGMGGMMAAGAAGVVGGMVLGGVAGEFFDDED